MPAVIPEHAALRTRLRDSADDALKLNDRLETVIAVKTTVSSTGTFHGKVDHSQPPWNAAAADAILDLHAWSREAEALSRVHPSLPPRPRGFSSRNTAKALESLLRLAEGLDDMLVRDNASWLARWSRRASGVLGETENARRLPRMVGETARPCPWCRRDTLRQLALAGLVFCIDPSCRDEEGRRPKAQLEYFGCEFVLRWMDGVIGTP